MMNEPETIQAVRAVLQRFQDGYTRREEEKASEFVAELFAPDADALIIGTGEDEWCLGTETITKLVYGDWEGWGDVVIDVPGAQVSSLGDVAWLAAKGTVTMMLETGRLYDNYLKHVGEIAAGAGTSRQKLVEVVRGAANTLYEGERGEAFVWPFRFAAVLVRRVGRWLFHQMQFSFPTTRFPDVRSL